MIRSRILHLFFLVALTLVLNGCGNGEGSSGSAAENSSDTTSTDAKISIGSNQYVSSKLLSTFDYTEWKAGAFVNSSMRNNLLNDIYSYFDDAFDFIFLVQNENESTLGYHR